MVKHSEELVEVVSEHDEVEWALESERNQGAFKLVNVGEDKFFQVCVKLDQGLPNERDISLKPRFEGGRWLALNKCLDD